MHDILGGVRCFLLLRSTNSLQVVAGGQTGAQTYGKKDEHGPSCLVRPSSHEQTGFGMDEELGQSPIVNTALVAL